MEFIEHVESNLAFFITILKLVLEIIAAFCILIGLCATGKWVVVYYRRRQARFPFVHVRLRFGMWLPLDLEFQLGADILLTAVAPTYEALGKLGAIALIRTFLNYFLHQELREEYELQEAHEPTINP